MSRRASVGTARPLAGAQPATRPAGCVKARASVGGAALLFAPRCERDSDRLTRVGLSDTRRWRCIGIVLVPAGRRVRPPFGEKRGTGPAPGDCFRQPATWCRTIALATPRSGACPRRRYRNATRLSEIDLLMSPAHKPVAYSPARSSRSGPRPAVRRMPPSSFPISLSGGHKESAGWAFPTASRRRTRLRAVVPDDRNARKESCVRARVGRVLRRRSGRHDPAGRWRRRTSRIRPRASFGRGASRRGCVAALAFTSRTCLTRGSSQSAPGETPRPRKVEAGSTLRRRALAATAAPAQREEARRQLGRSLAHPGSRPATGSTARQTSWRVLDSRRRRPSRPSGVPRDA